MGWGNESLFKRFGQMTKMAAMPIYGKHLKNLLHEIKWPMTLKLGMQHRVLEYYQIYSSDDPVLTLTYFTARSNFVPYAFVWEKGKTMDFQKLLYSMMSKLVYAVNYTST